MTDVAPTLGFIAADWIETFCTQGPGDQQDEMFRLNDDQLKFLLDAYELEPVTGKRRYRRAALVRGKGHGKSTLAAAICCFEALGPARFSHWDSDGNPVGKTVINPQIRCLATAEDQASNVYDAVLHMFQHGPLRSFSGVDPGQTRILLPGGGSIRPVSSSSMSRDGGRETFVEVDESHLWMLPELHRLHQTMVRNLAKRHQSQAWMLETTTAFAPGQNSVAENTMAYGAKIASGEVTDWHMLYDHRVVPDTFDLDDPEQRMAALLFSYGAAADHVDLEQASRLWDDPQTVKEEWRRFWLSQVVTSSDAFIDHEDWAACADATLTLHDSDTITLGIDSSLVDDATAVVACRLSDGFVTILGLWQKPEGRAGINWQVPFAEVDACVRSAFATYRVLRCYADPQYIHSYLEQWSLEFGDRVRSWTTHRTIAMAAALERFYVAVKTHEGVRHDGSTLLTTHVLNARTFRSQGRVLIKKDSPHSPRKIDACVSAVLAFEAAADARTAKEDVEEVPKRKRSWSF